MVKPLLRLLLLVPLLLTGCNVVMTLFSVPLQPVAGSIATITIAGNISGNTGEAGCVLQLPVGWTITQVTNNHSWNVVRDAAALLALYAAEPGHYLAAFSGTGTGGIGGSQTLSEIRLSVSVLVPANALGPYAAKLSLAGSASVGAWQIAEPAGVAQFANITAAPYARPMYVGVPAPVDYLLDGSNLPPNQSLLRWSGLAFGDVDGDGRDDLAAVDSFGTGTRCWLARPGTAWVERSSGLPANTLSAAVAFGDLDGDGLLDLVDGNGHVCFGDGGTTWTLGAALPLTVAPGNYSSIAVGDVDGDGLPDIAIGTFDGRLQVLRNNGNRTFRNASAGLPVGGVSDVPRTLCLVDLDGDGDRDMVWAHVPTSNLWINDGSGNWSGGLGLPGSLRSLTTGDLDGDGVPEIVVAPAGAGIQVWKHAFGASWAQLPTVGLPTIGTYEAMALVDFDRDGRLDLVAGRSTGQGGVDLWRNTASGFVLSAAPGLPTYVGGDVVAIAVGDFDGNTFPDLGIATAGGGLSQAGENLLQTYQDRHAGAAPYGPGCGGGPVPGPLLMALGAPQRGNTSFALRVATQTPSAIAILWLGGSRTLAATLTLPLDLTPFGGPGCTLLASLDNVYAGLTDGAGELTIGLPVPNDPALALATVFTQGGMLAPAANAFGMVFTGGAAVRID